MADDINVVFGADTIQLDAAVSKVKSEMQSLTPGAPGSGILTPLPQAFGGAPSTLLERATAAAKANAAAAQEAGTAMKNFARAEDEASEAAGRAGINFGAMAERLVARLVIFEAVRLAIQGIKYAFDQVSNLQQAKIQFDATSGSVEELTTNFKSLQLEQKAALEPDIGKMVQTKNALEDFGTSERKAILETQDLSQWSKILGVDAVKLAEAIGRVSRGEDIEGISGRLVTHMMGEQSAAGHQLIQSLVDQENALKRLESQNAVVAKTMEAVTRATEQMDERVTRLRTRGQEFLKETGLLPAIQAQLPKLAMHPGVSPEFLQATGQLKLPQMAPGTAPQVTNLVTDYIQQYTEGLKEIQKEYGLTDEAMRANARAGVFSTDYIMRKYKDAHDDRMRNFREENQEETRRRQGQVTTAEAGILATKAEFARVGPQAVTAPPTARWDEYLNSIKGVGDQAKTMLDAKISDVVKAIGEAVGKLDAIRSADEGTLALLSGGT